MNQIEQAKQTAKHRDHARLDMFVNAYNGFGGTRDPMYRIGFSAGIILTKTELEDMFRHNWLARKICEAIPQDATRQWIDIKADDQDIITDIMGQMDILEVQTKIEEALTLARLYGGSIIILGAPDGQPPDTPLNEDRIFELKSLNVVDRWQVWIDKTYDDVFLPNFGQPEIYRLQPITAGTAIRQGQRIHESRLLRFDGAYLPEIIKIGNAGWHDSVLQSINEELRRHGVSIQSGAILFQDFITKALKLPNLAELLGTIEGQTALMTRTQYAISNNSSLGIVLLGEDEELTKIQTPIAGLVEMLNIYIELISAASNIPRARLFGQSLGVLAGATETTRTYYDMIAGYQQKYIRRQLEKLIKIIFKAKNSATKGKEPENWSFDFKPLWQQTEKETAEIRKLYSEIDTNYINNQTYSPEEVCKSRFGPDGYSTEMTIDLKTRAEFEKQVQEEQAKQMMLLQAQTAQGATGQIGQGEDGTQQNQMITGKINAQ